VQFDDTINQWHTCTHSGRINASNPCVTGDTRVLCPGGIWRRIDQMIHLPARVMTNLDGQEVHATEGAFPTGVKEVFELRTQSGYSVKLTADHQVWTRQRGWVRASELAAGDQLQLPARPAVVQSVGEPAEPALFQLVGLYLSAANGDLSSVHLDQCLHESQVIDHLAHYVGEKWEIYPDDYVDTSMVSDSSETSGKMLTLTLTNRRLISRLAAFVRSDSGRRRLADEAFTAGLPAQKHLLKALFTADGRWVDNTIELGSDSFGLLHDIQLLLLGFGVRSTMASGGLTDLALGGLPGRRDLHGSGDEALQGGALEPTASRFADTRRHGLRIDPGSLRLFARHIGLLEGQQHLADLAAAAPPAAEHSYDSFAALMPLGRRQVFDLTEPVTSSFVANGLTVHNCSEYMFLDDTACNLASLNVLSFFDSESRRFDIDAYRHAARLWTVVLEISVLMASFPSEAIAKLSYRYRTLGLGYANLGAMLMQAGIPYDSEAARAVCAAMTSILTGESYATSAEMAGELGAFAGYEDNKADMLRVMRNHRRAAYDVARSGPGAKALGSYEGLEIPPVGIDASQFNGQHPLLDERMLLSARECWDRALCLGERHGYRNAQVSVIAPTGTIGLLMDCDTTGVEPDFALVKFKKLAGGGYFKIANQSLRPALVNLGYSSHEIHDILRHVMGTLTLDGAPHINRDSLRLAGLTEQDLDNIEHALPGVFELQYAFNGWILGEQTMQRLGIGNAEWEAKDFDLLQRLGFTRKQVKDANDVVCGRGTVEGAPHLRLEHYPVFDCANRCGEGKRYIAVEGHIRMMAAAQPFISGAISKTINMPAEATVEDIKNSYYLSWKLGLKANALYRDGSKLSQPLNVKSDEDLDKKTDEDDEHNVEAAKDQLAGDVARGTAAAVEAAAQPAVRGDNIAPASTSPIEKIIERIVERPLRRRLPDTRRALTHKFDVAGHEGYITVGLYEDGAPGEVFITMAKEGSTIGGLMDTIATLVSVALQYGVPVESLVRKFEHVRFEPSGMTRNRDIPFAKSLVDYIFRWLAMEFIAGYRSANAPQRPKSAPAAASEAPPAPTAPAADAVSVEEAPPLARPDIPVRKKTGGNGHGPRMEPDTAKPFDYGDNTATRLNPGAAVRPVATDALSQQGSDMQSDAPACDVCGSITVRSGTCYKCLNCGNSMGCS
jgi:ribonucleoside-diphosphate reductase alpha chain